MSLESADFIPGLVETNPEGTDPKSQGDDHLKLLKHVLKSQFPAFTGEAVTKTEAQLNSMLIAGDFGLGGMAVDISDIQMDAPDLPTGFYYVTASGSGSAPGNFSGYMIYVDHTTASMAMQLYINSVSTEQYVRVKTPGGWTPWRTQWDSANTPKQSSPVDNNAPALLNPGSFGLGTSIAAGASANLNNAPFRGPYNARWAGASWSNQPPSLAGTALGVVEWTSYSVDWGQQEFISLTTAERFVRYWSSGTTWSPWFLVAAIVQQQIAATGFRYQNGMVEQWGVTANIPSDTSVQVVFPKAMSAAWGAVASPSNFVVGQNGATLFIAGLTPTTMNIANRSAAALGSGPCYWRAWGAP